LHETKVTTDGQVFNVFHAPQQTTELNVVLAEGFGYAEGMRKRGRIILAAAIFTLLGGLAAWVLTTRQPSPPDPVYNGNTLSAWLNQMPGQKPPPLDTNAVPYLIMALNAHDGVLRKTYTRLWAHFPSWIQDRTPAAGEAEAWMIRRNACQFLAVLGVNARPAIPGLVRLLKEDNNSGVRLDATIALGQIADDNDRTVVEALISATKDKDLVVSTVAGRALSHIDREAAVKAGVK
jgi:HEAT repeats